MQLEELPLTPSGKVDRKRLPKPGLSQGKTYVAPKTEIEEILCDIWAQVLKLEKVGTEDNFFEIGGDSIIGIQVITKANKAGIRLNARDLFRCQTVSQLANAAAAAQSVLAEMLPMAATREKPENTFATPNEFAVAEINADQLQAVLQQMQKKKQHKPSKSVV
jgi:acyl carrier protein